jgi:site-specific DNA-methyltransferase (cytosine-N4-specific)
MLRIVSPDYQLFPYERILAAREIEAAGGRIVGETGTELLVRGTLDAESLRKLTYAVRVEDEHGLVVEPDLARIEATNRTIRQRRGSRQSTRYHLHGIHDYKGKFNPQIVRAFANLLEVEEEDWLIDPFCGSGTALLEGMSLGANVLGIDRSPMAAFLARTKARAFMNSRPDRLIQDLRRWISECELPVSRAEASGQLDLAGLGALNSQSVEYLRSWFPASPLAALSGALATRESLRGVAYQLAGMVVSTLCRTVSLQKPEDLRIRRRDPEFVPPPIFPLLCDAAEEVCLGLRELELLPARTGKRVLVRLGSASARSLYAGTPGRPARRTVISSPPYATALPYIDTDRLSIVLLGLAQASELGALERTLMGSREWRVQEQRYWAGSVSQNHERLPSEVAMLCRRLAEVQAGAGFRRRAVPGLLYRYFAGMRSALDALSGALVDGDRAVFIVGANRTTTTDGISFDIDTPRLLAAVAEEVGFEVTEILALDAFPRFGLHRANGIDSESAVLLRRVAP